MGGKSCRREVTNFGVGKNVSKVFEGSEVGIRRGKAKMWERGE